MSQEGHLGPLQPLEWHCCICEYSHNSKGFIAETHKNHPQNLIVQQTLLYISTFKNMAAICP